MGNEDRPEIVVSIRNKYATVRSVGLASHQCGMLTRAFCLHEGKLPAVWRKSWIKFAARRGLGNAAHRTTGNIYLIQKTVAVSGDREDNG